MVGCGLLSLGYLLTASPLAAVGGHIVLHSALTLRGTEMPPYATGGPHVVPLGHRRARDGHTGPIGPAAAHRPVGAISPTRRLVWTRGRQPPISRR